MMNYIQWRIWSIRAAKWTVGQGRGHGDLDVNIQDIIDTWKIITTSLTTEYVRETNCEVHSITATN